MRWFANLRVQLKLLLAFGALTLVMLLVGLNALRTMGSIQGNFQQVYDHRLISITEAANIRGAMLRVRTSVLQHLMSADAAKMKEYEDLIRKFDATIDEELRKYEANPLGSEEAQAVAVFKKSWSEFKDARNSQILPLSAAGKKSEAIAVALGAVGQRFADASRAIDDLFAVNVRVGDSLLRAGQQEYASARWLTIAIVLGGATLSALLGFTIAPMMARPLGKAVDVLEAVAMGDFTRRLELDTQDEIGRMARALNEAVSAMRTALVEVSAAADQAAIASGELSSAGEQLASGAQEQAASLEETAAALEEITATVKQNADNARQADQLANGSRDVAEKGGAVVASAVTAMAEINEASRKIAAIITTIDEIAFQTNLLALNAAVEAARAGEQGRGFAVVATEVRSLAQRSATAAREIKTLIQDSVTKVESGSTLVTQSGQTLGEIVASVKRVTDIIGEIAAASGEQSTGIDQVNLAVTQMDQVTQTNAAQTEELSSTAQGLAAQARRLQSLVARFQLGNGAGPTRARAETPLVRRSPAPPVTRRPATAERMLVGAGKANGASAPHGVDDGFEEF